VKVGLFGGSFDPVHNAHLFIAEALRSSEGLERVVFLPTRGGHHREPPRASIDDRTAMLRLAIAPNPAFSLDPCDAGKDATGYTADVIPQMSARFPGDELYFIAGGDSLVRSQWHRFDEILAALTGFLVAPRGDVTPDDIAQTLGDLPAALRDKVRTIDLPRVSESATLVRERIEAGESIRYLVPEPVWRYIVERSLYRTAPRTEAAGSR
jgi:nicotinate-nucleotide adenylyltransferase